MSGHKGAGPIRTACQRRWASKNWGLGAELRLVIRPSCGGRKRAGRQDETDQGGEATEGSHTKSSRREGAGRGVETLRSQARQVVMSSSEMSLIAESAIMRSEFYGMEC